MATHTQDTDCTVDPVTQLCGCGVYHGDKCHECGGRGFHKPGCAEVALDTAAAALAAKTSGTMGSLRARPWGRS